MTVFTETTLTDAVLARLGNTVDPRFKHVMTSLILHLHDFVREVELTEEEWFEGIKFLTATGQQCNDKRQEYILLSDVLGVSMLVDAINHRRPGGATENTVLGPFYVHGAPEIRNGDDMAAGWKGEPTYVGGTVRSTDGKPIAGALLDMWQSNSEGWYDVQLPDTDGKQLRARLRADKDGRFWFRTIKPTAYPVPTDGPVGLILNHMGRHPMRPAHLHFIVSAPGCETVVTHLFVKGDQYLESDVVFAVKGSLVIEFTRNDSEAEATKVGLTAPFYTASYDFVLKPADKAKQQKVISAADAARA
ncbi:MAG TPA: intradiol ring-cleavage dioxygenase [Methylomirabilota bacterium]|nr:intradiol ring-cleavage dioxygenase [Methylomirabilota bacterium]